MYFGPDPGRSWHAHFLWLGSGSERVLELRSDPTYLPGHWVPWYLRSAVMVRSFGKISERKQEQTHNSPMGGMRQSDCEHVLRSAAARPDFWSLQHEKERDIVSVIDLCSQKYS